MSKGSNPAGRGLPIEAGVTLLRPRLLALRAEQRAEAVTLLCELLLAAARRGTHSARF